MRLMINYWPYCTHRNIMREAATWSGAQVFGLCPKPDCNSLDDASTSMPLCEDTA